MYKPAGNKENHSAEFFLMNTFWKISHYSTTKNSQENHPAEFFLMTNFWKISHYSTTKNSQQQPSEESSVFF